MERMPRPIRSLLQAGALAFIAACATPSEQASDLAPSPPTAQAAPAPPPPRAPARVDWPGANGNVQGRNERLLVYLPAAKDTLEAVAERFLGQRNRAWEIAQANGGRWTAAAGVPLIVPLQPVSRNGLTAESIQTVPILCYHRFGTGSSKMIVSPAQFEAQLAWLANNQFRVISLDELALFLAGQAALPQRSVVITIDDGYESVHRHAFPALRKHGFTATLFVYTDFVGARDALSWAQLQEMASSGVIDIQAHSKTHRNLIERGPGESDSAYRQNIDTELRQPRSVLERRLGAQGVRVRHFAFPFGDANELVVQTLQQQKYELGVTVNAGGNPFYADPMMLRRTMIFGDHSLEDFKTKLQIHRPLLRP
jgi:peptidoglycan/xylan/chitin deacetylase (PgdA/CDA1 family)